jgi:hypothetical protein
MNTDKGLNSLNLIIIGIFVVISLIVIDDMVTQIYRHPQPIEVQLQVVPQGGTLAR